VEYLQFHAILLNLALADNSFYFKIQIKVCKAFRQTANLLKLTNYFSNQQNPLQQKINPPQYNQ